LGTRCAQMAHDGQRAVRGWLLCLWALVLLMVMVGGVTRLTGSGLSMVEWRPVSGALPPLSAAAWQTEFAAYQHSPQFQQQNHWMTLGDFKQIFFWEYLHRLLGRAIGLATVLPWLYFVWRRVLTGGLAARTFSIVLLGGLQGVLGWWMVKSGLVNEPRVSHYRLAAHLVLGIGVGQWILWQALELLGESRPPPAAARAGLRAAIWAVVPILLCQVIYGAFMAGTHAGLIAPTFPDMNGHYAPGSFFTSSLSHDLFDNPLSIHYLHRALAFGLLLYAVTLVIALRREHADLRAAALFLCLATLGQGALGALTVLLRVPVGVAVAHQGGAYVLCSAAVLLLHAALRPATHETRAERASPPEVALGLSRSNLGQD
jgi:cytochrome c oxidase assembly protein subunit 15